jgi:hypothetical protein
MAAFETVAAVIPVARRLRQQWRPLTFEVADMHLLSSSSSFSTQFGCDARVSLGDIMDETEEETDSNTTSVAEEMIQMMCELGEPGGFFQQNNQTTTPTTNGDDTTRDHLDLERWLDGAEEDEEEEDQGTVVVLGRTQLFTGHIRVIPVIAPKTGFPRVRLGPCDRLPVHWVVTDLGVLTPPSGTR